MSFRAISLFILLASLFVACAEAPTPTPLPVSLPSPTPMPTLSPTLLPTLVFAPSAVFLPKLQNDRYAPPDVPSCKGAKLLDEPIKFGWENTVHSSSSVGFSNIPENEWTYYRCSESPAALVAFYKQSMPVEPYNWLEIDIEARSEGTMAVYNNSLVSMTHGYRWVYLWVFPVKPDDSVANLVAAWWDAPHTC